MEELVLARKKGTVISVIFTAIDYLQSNKFCFQSLWKISCLVGDWIHSNTLTTHRLTILSIKDNQNKRFLNGEKYLESDVKLICSN